MCTVLLLVCRFIIQMNSTHSFNDSTQPANYTTQPKHRRCDGLFSVRERENLHEKFPKSENFLLKYHLWRNRNGVSKRIPWFSFCSSVVMHKLQKVLSISLNLELCLLHTRRARDGRGTFEMKYYRFWCPSCPPPPSGEIIILFERSFFRRWTNG